jgi:hypothetical protein
LDYFRLARDSGADQPKKSSKSVAGRHYIERDVEAVRKELEKLEAAFVKTR